MAVIPNNKTSKEEMSRLGHIKMLWTFTLSLHILVQKDCLKLVVSEGEYSTYLHLGVLQDITFSPQQASHDL